MRTSSRVGSSLAPSCTVITPGSVNRHVLLSVFEPPQWQKPRITHVVGEVGPHLPGHHHLSPACFWRHGVWMSGSWEGCRFGRASPWLPLQKRVPWARDLDVNLTAISTSTMGLRTLGSGRVQRLPQVCPCDCEVGMEPPACISESFRFLE